MKLTKQRPIGMLSAGNAGASAGVNGDNWPGSEHLTTTGHLLHAGGPSAGCRLYTAIHSGVGWTIVAEYQTITMTYRFDISLIFLHLKIG